MPRRRKPPTEISSDEIALLLPHAQTPDTVIARERDAHKQRKLERVRNLARDRLIQMCRRAEKCGQMGQLNFDVRLFWTLLKDRNKRIVRERLHAAFPEKTTDEIERILGEGSLPEPKGGRPTKEDDRLLIAADMLEAIERVGIEKRGSVETALEEVRKTRGTTTGMCETSTIILIQTGAVTFSYTWPCATLIQSGAMLIFRGGRGRKISQ